jgi:hypothetical protein
MDDDYYDEITIEVDGWLMNPKDAPPRPPRLQHFPSARRLLQAWDHPGDFRVKSMM